MRNGPPSDRKYGKGIVSISGHLWSSTSSVILTGHIKLEEHCFGGAVVALETLGYTNSDVTDVC